jgi:UDP-N-acetylbacillosamine N-acetyltransferase
MNTYKGLLILGFGGHARSIADVALAVGITELLFVDANAREGEDFLGHRVVREYAGKLPESWACLPAVGDNEWRQKQFANALESGWPLATLIAPGATLGAGATIGEGSFVARHAHVGPMARVGKGAIINTGAAIEHDCVVSDFVHVSVNATLAGRSRLGDFVFLGAGGTVIDSVEVGSHITIGAGGVVVDSITSPGTYVGVPARRLDK